MISFADLWGDEEPIATGTLSLSLSLCARKGETKRQQMASAADGAKAGIRVCARFRPQNKLEVKQQAVECVRVDADNTRVQIENVGRSGEALTFTFDQVFGTKSTQAEVYAATAKPLVESALRGYNCTCFVYGQTGTGKTFSMEGVPGDAEYAGIIPRVMDDIFDGIQNMQAELEFLVRVSYIEIYLEKIRDLLEPSSNNLSVRESRERGVWIAGATEVCCASADEMMGVMCRGGANRVISSTRMNNDSSRSHSVFIITIEQRNVATGSTRSGKLFLVDLAGSEKVGKTHAKGQTLKEAQHINKSLSALGSVMNALTSGVQSNAHIPYRDSKLTRLLQDSLGGNSETTLLVCGSCSSYNSEETISTLRFGTRAKNIKNKPKVNEEKTVAEYKVLVTEKDKQIAALEAQLQQFVATAEGAAPTAPSVEDAEKIQKLLDKIEQLEDEQTTKAVEIATLDERCNELEAKSKDMERQEIEMASIKNQNDEFVHKIAFLESELAAKTKECGDLNTILEKRRAKKPSGPDDKVPDATTSSLSIPATIAEDSVACVPENTQQDDVAVAAAVNEQPVVDRRRADSALLDNELLRQQLSARAHELSLSSKRIDQLAEELVNCRNFYEDQVFALQEKLREYADHLRALMEVSENEDKTKTSQQLDNLLHHAKTLRAVRGGGGAAGVVSMTAPREQPPSIPENVASTVPPLQQRARIVSSANSQDGWIVDDEVFPIAPIDMESPVVKRLIASMPEKGREKMSKWLVFVLEGRDIRSNFHPEISIEGINENLNRDMRKLIVPLLKNRRDLDVQSFMRTRFVRVTDLKITLVHKHQDTVHVDASETGGESDRDGADAGKTRSGSNPAASGKVIWARDHVFYGPKSDPSSPSVLHGERMLLPSKDRFTSEPVDLSASVSESKTMLDVNPPSSSSSTAPSSSSGAPSSGGVFGRLRSKTNVGAMFGDVKSIISARYHKHHVHEDTLCDGCGMSPIIGGRWKCNTCENFELCDNCYGAGVHGYEVSNEMCRRIEHAAVHKHRLLGDYPELFELFRRHICYDDVIQFRRVVDWLVDMVSGTHIASIHRKIIVKTGLHPEIRARLVAQLGALASERPDIVLKTEWFVEKTAEGEQEEAEEEEDTESTNSDRSALKRGSSASSSEANASSATTSVADEVQLETLRMYVTDATIEETVEAARKISFSDLLEPAPVAQNRRTASTASTGSAGGPAVKSVTSVEF
ncbi:Kinesin-related protein 3, partial [Globisporangium splendens]